MKPKYTGIVWGAGLKEKRLLTKGSLSRLGGGG
jgi:hypothetical protein